MIGLHKGFYGQPIVPDLAEAAITGKRGTGPAMKTEMDAKQLQNQAENAAQLLTAMANQKRLMILCHLLDSEKSVGEIASLVDLGQSPLSQHLAKLRALGLVSTRRVGQSIRYRVASMKVEEVLKTLYGIYCTPE